MEEFNTIEKAKELFKSVDGLGKTNNIFVSYKDLQKNSGMVNGMEYPYEGLLINETEKGIGMFYLHQPGLVLTQNINKMEVLKDKYFFIPKENIKKITIKKFALLNNKIKRISIETNDNRCHKIFAKIVEKNIPYQEENFMNFIKNN